MMDLHEWKFNEKAEVIYCWKCLLVQAANHSSEYGSCFPTKADKERIQKARDET